MAPGHGAGQILITRRIFPDLLEDLRRQHSVIDNQADEIWDAPALAARLAGVQGVLADLGTRFGPAELAAAPQLRVLSNIAVGYNNLDLAACTAAGVMATNTPDVLTQATADHAWALLMAAARRVVESDRWTRAGHWRRFAFDAFLGADVHGATLGVLGMGRIGAAVARRAAGFDMPVIFHKRSALPGSRQDGALAVTREELFARSDFLVVLAPYSAATHHAVGAAELAAMKPGAVLVNIARGGLVDDAALAQALRAGKLRAAALDVMENEPAIHPGLLGLENVVLTPHIGSATDSSRRGMVRLAIANLLEGLKGGRPAALLNPDVVMRAPWAPAQG
jgi:lactate dehydrogenase-like 2-hydroxyacid dehydrogenase